MDNSKDLNQSLNYHIRIQGHFQPCWEGWFDNLTITCEPDGNTLLSGYLPDQAALYGLIQKLQNLGITLCSINRSE